MADLDKMSLMMGSIQSDIKHILDTTEAASKKLDGMHESVIIVTASTKSAHKRLDKDITPHIEDYKKMKQRGIGIMSTISVVFGFIGAMVLKSLQFLLG